MLEADERLRFTLDGQLMPIDDYLEIRPGAESRIRRLVEAGRLAIGPWQTLMDEFLVSGESIVRNLENGLARADEFGGAMRIGYLPDMFGHVAQMPQILRRAGIEIAVVWRGVPAAVDEHVFTWQAPDGSSVRAEYLPDGYGNGAYLFDAPDGPVRLRGLVERLQPFFGDDEPLAMVGTDHMPAVRDLPDRIAEADHEARIETLADYFERAADELSLTWRGELRSAERANLLPGVLSTRIDLKAACARAERSLTRYAEPLQALYGDVWPDELLRVGWSRVFQNAAHDSICGCSIDAVSAQVLVRYAEAEQIGEELTRRALARIADDVPHGAVAVANPSAHDRTGLVELSLEVPDEWSEVGLETPDGAVVATQETGRKEPLLYETVLLGPQVVTGVERRIHGRELFGRVLNGFRIEGRLLTLEVGEAPDPPHLDVGGLLHEIELATAGESNEWRIRIVARPRRTLVAAVSAPPLGWTSVRPVEGRGVCDDAVRLEGRTVRNGSLVLEALDDGTLSVNGISFARLVDGGDFGDSYNYAPPAEDLLVDEPEATSVSVRARGPVLGALETIRRYQWPRGVAADGSSRLEETRPVEITTRAELRAGEAFVRTRIDFENPSDDHRLRVHVSLARPAETSFGEGQFAVIERGTVPEGGFGEPPLATYPAHGFIDAGGVALLLGHACEFELLDGRELALTALRSVGLISRSAHPNREEPAGPEIEIPAAQCRGPWSFAFAIYPHEGAWHQAGVASQAERYHHGFLTVGGSANDTRRAAWPGLEIRPNDVVLTSLRRRGSGLEARIVNEHPDARTVSVAGVEVELSAWEIRTLRLDDAL
jgi:Glycosyl hydrolases family 38 N-terminal domain/Alpha mannosidase middle domain